MSTVAYLGSIRVYVVVVCFNVGGNLLSNTLPGAVPSARAGLASGFGMGNRAFPCRYFHRQTCGTQTWCYGCYVRYCIVDALHTRGVFYFLLLCGTSTFLVTWR